MSFDNMLEQSPEVAPLLVRLYETNNLYGLAGTKNSPEAQSELTTVVVDLLTIKLSLKESELITDVLVGLMKQAEKDLRQALADRLAAMETVPLRMLLHLANDEISIADPILRQSPVFEDMDLIYIIKSKGRDYWQSIAHRKSLSPAIINVLADTKDEGTAIILSENERIQLTDHAFSVISDMAQTNEDVARPLLMRDDLPRGIAAKLYEAVGEELKKQIAERFGADGQSLMPVFNSVIAELKDADSHAYEPADTLLSHAENLKRRGELKVGGMISTLRRGQMATFIAEFSVFCSLSMETVKMMLKQENGKMLAVACKAMDLQKTDFVSIFLLTDRIRSQGKRIISHTELTRLMNIFDMIKPEDARAILKNSRH